MTSRQIISDAERTKEARVESLGWGALFIAVGAVLITPGLPDDAWLVAVGAVMLATAVARAVLGLRILRTTVVVGVAALVGGVAGIAGLGGAAWPLVMIAVGIAIAVLAFVPRRITSAQHLFDATWRTF